ncbi:MAG: helix-turn-helix domain-containing protein [Smithella sp.]
MGKKFAKLTYYEMLDIKPDVPSFEVRNAYNAAVKLYQTDSLTSYSFFSPEERKEILACLEKAYFTLINEKKREDYDSELIELGILDESARKPVVKKSVNIFNINRVQVRPDETKNASTGLRAKVLENNLIREIISQEKISGADLRRIRDELAVPLENIALETRILINYLRAIEGDDSQTFPAAVFLKGFIKAYLKCLCLEPAEEICMKYLNHLSSREQKT